MLYYKLKIIKAGQLLFKEGLVDARAGNLSVRLDGRVLITRTGRHVGELSLEDIIELPLYGESVLEKRASSEWVVHKEIYLQTSHRAVVHAHPPKAVILSMSLDHIEPIDSEGKALLGSIKVLPDYPSGSLELARAVSEELKNSKLVVVRGHGVFSVGNDPLEGYSLISVLERSCGILLS
jgi:L-fuculose-phosphate aldolase